MTRGKDRPRKTALAKDFWRSIAHSKGRFFSVVLLMAFGCFALTGLYATGPDMRATGDAYFDEYHAADLSVISDYGLDEDDVAAIDQVTGATAIEYGYFKDVVAEGTDDAVRVYSATEEVSLFELTEGRMPEATDEIALGSTLADDYPLGSTFAVTETADTLTGETVLTVSEFTVVGYVNSTEILSTVNLGESTAGTGSLEGYAVVTEDVFDSDVYMIARLTFDDLYDLNCYSTEYRDLVQAHKEELEELLADRPAGRLATIKADSQAEIDDAQAEVDDAKAELADAEAELADAAEQIAEAADAIDEARETLSSEVAAGQAELDDAWAELVDAAAQLADARAELDEAATQIAEGEAALASGQAVIDAYQAQLADAEEELAESLALLEEKQAEYDEGVAAYEEGLAAYEAGLAAYEESLAAFEEACDAYEANWETVSAQWAASETLYETLAALDAAGALPDAYAETYAQLVELKAAYEELVAFDASREASEAALAESKEALDAVQVQLAESKATLDAAAAELEAGRAAYEEGLAEYESGAAELAASQAALDESAALLASSKATYQAGIATYNESVAAYNEGLAAYWEGVATLESSQAEGEEQIADTEAELADAEAEYADGLAEYEDALPDAEAKIADAEAEIADAAETLELLDTPSYEVDTRREIPGALGYTMLVTVADIIDAIGRVFPVFLYLVAMLVAFTTMTRMVDEERGNSGTLKALGYSDADIAKKFVLYGLFAGTVGSALGIALGHIILPLVFFNAFSNTLNYPPLTMGFYPLVSLGAYAAALVCSVLPAWVAVKAQLREKPAELLLPKVPKGGSRIFLERVKPIWRRLSFTYKVTARNLFRYKQRMLMTVLGVAGAVCILTAGFGVQGSIGSMGERQFGNIINYEMIAVNASTARSDDLAEIDELLAEDGVKSSLGVHYETLYKVAGDNGDRQEITLLVPEDEGAFDDYLCLANRKSGEELELGTSGAVISERLATLLDVGVGDTIELEDGDGTSRSITVTGICEMYLGHFVFMTSEAYEEAFGEDFSANATMVRLEDTSQESVAEWSARLLELDGVKGVSQNIQMENQVDTIVDSVGMIMSILIIVAIMLGVVIMYNLTNLNVSERMRELSTIKVLGFNNKETTMYIYRETIVLTALGILAGFVLGVWLHQFIINVVPPDNMMFDPRLSAMEFVYPAVVIAGITFVLYFVVKRRLKNVDMLEALKSVD